MVIYILENHVRHINKTGLYNCYDKISCDILFSTWFTYH